MATREDVLKEFPELADPNFKHPDDPSYTAEQCIQDWITYWGKLSEILYK